MLLAVVEILSPSNGDRRLVVHHRRERGDTLMIRVVAEGLLSLEPPGLTADVSARFPSED